MNAMAKKVILLCVAALAAAGYGTTKTLVRARTDAAENARLCKELRAARQLIGRYREELAAVGGTEVRNE